MARPRDGFKGRMVELPVGLWARIEALGGPAGIPLASLIEDGMTRYCNRPPKALPTGRKVGRKVGWRKAADGQPAGG